MKPYKQTSSQSCLSVCLLLAIDDDITPKKELELLYEGLQTTDPYAVSVIMAFVEKYKKNVAVHVDNNYYRAELNEKYGTKHISILYSKVDATLLESLKLPYIVYLETHTLLNTWDYSPHFVIVESITDNFFTIIDPSTGKRMRIGKKKLVESIATLRNRIHYCPLVIKIAE